MSAQLAFYLAGSLAIVVGIVHGILGERLLLSRVPWPNRRMRILSRGIWWDSVAAWAGAGLLYIVIGRTGPSPLATAVVLTEAVVLGIGVACNFHATRGRHPGWVLLAIAIALSLYGLAAG